MTALEVKKNHASHMVQVEASKPRHVRQHTPESGDAMNDELVLVEVTSRRSNPRSACYPLTLCRWLFAASNRRNRGVRLPGGPTIGRKEARCEWLLFLKAIAERLDSSGASPRGKQRR